MNAAPAGVAPVEVAPGGARVASGRSLRSDRRRLYRLLAVTIPVVLLAAACNKAFDFNGDGKADVMWIDQATTNWYTWADPTLADPSAQPTLVRTGVGNDQWPVPGDYNGSGKYTPAYVNSTGWVTGGAAGTLAWPAPSGDQAHVWRIQAAYNGAHKTLPAYFRDTDDTWFIYGHAPIQLGSGRSGHNDEDIPVPADYDGDGITDLATYNPWTSTWTVRNSHDLSITTTVLGDGPAGFPTAGDFNGDGKAERAWVSWQGVWTIEGHAPVTVPALQPQTAPNDYGVLPAVADYDGNGKDDIAGAYGTKGAMWLWRDGVGAIPLQVPGSDHVGIPVNSHIEDIVQIARLTALYQCKVHVANPSNCPT